MALIKCKECGHTISDKALKCPKCGNPKSEQQRKDKIEIENSVAIDKNSYVKSEPEAEVLPQADALPETKSEAEVEAIDNINNTNFINRNKKRITIATLSIICIVLGWYCIGYFSKYIDTKTDNNLKKSLVQYNNIIVLGDGFAKVELNGKYGCINSSGELIIPCQYENITKYDDGFIVTNDKYGVIDLNGNTVLLCEYKDIYYWRKDCVDGELSSLSYDYLREGSTHLGVCCQELIYKNNKITVQTEDSIFDWCNGKLMKHIEEYTRKSDNENEYYNTRNNMTRIFSKNYKKWGYGDENGNIVIPCIYDIALDFYNGLAIVGFKNPQNSWGYKYTIIDKNGNKITDWIFDNILRCADGFIASIDNYKGALDENGNMITIFKYLQVSNYKGDFDYLERYNNKANIFEEGLAVVKNIDGKFGYIDKSGKEVIECKYDDAYDFSEGLALVTLNNKYGYIDKNGNVVIPFKYNYARDFSNFMAIICEQKYGIIDNNGNEIVPAVYDVIEEYSKDYFFAKKDDKKFFIRKDGKIIE